MPNLIGPRRALDFSASRALGNCKQLPRLLRRLDFRVANLIKLVRLGLQLAFVGTLVRRILFFLFFVVLERQATDLKAVGEANFVTDALRVC
jgi:hypothetical protein